MSASTCLVEELLRVVHTEPCNATWTVYTESNAFGGIRLSTANDVTTCLQGCQANRRCRAADYNASSPVGRRCFLHFSAAVRVNVGRSAGVSHYSISRLCPSTTQTFCLVEHGINGWA